MRVDLVITELDLGGAEKCMVDIAVHLHEQKHAVRLIAMGPESMSDRNSLVQRLREAGLDPIFLNGKGIRDYGRVKSRLTQLVKEDTPQVAMSFLFHANFLSSKIYPQSRVPLIVGVRVADRSRWRAWFSRRVYRNADRIVCVSQAVAKHAVRFEGADSAKTEVIHNGILLEDIERRAKGELDARVGIKPPYLLFVGRYAEQKRIEWVLELLEQPFFAESKHQLVMVGHGPLSHLVDQAASKHPHRIVNVGRQTHAIHWIANCEFLLLPSLYEGMPNVVLEAMACGKPVVATNAEGVGELLGSESTIQVNDIHDKATWFGHIRKLMNEPSTKKNLGEMNRLRCNQLFLLKDKMEAYERMLVSRCS